jgi:hypothetical protein
MTAKAYRSNLGDWENPPIIQDQVLAYMDSLGAPVLLREVYRPLGLPKEHVNRVLGRLHAKGVLTRWKIPVSTHRPVPRSGKAMADAATRQCFLYAFTGGLGQ